MHGQTNIHHHHHLPPWIRSFDLFWHRRVNLKKQTGIYTQYIDTYSYIQSGSPSECVVSERDHEAYKIRTLRVVVLWKNKCVCVCVCVYSLIFFRFLFYKYMIVFLFNIAIYVFLLEEAMYSYCCLCILIVSLCTLIVVYVFILLSMYS